LRKSEEGDFLLSLPDSPWSK